MSSSTNLEETIREGAANPRRATIDGNTAEQHNLRDQIEVDKYLSSKTAAQNRGLGVRFDADGDRPLTITLNRAARWL